ncbi:hypothetical protein N431DRAFT_480447 [Stipitochalara longipes BDJ]|nr:hypothetical protein N431DRAFT_480447 [Stipitochalara longipes BDJ]
MSVLVEKIPNTYSTLVERLAKTSTNYKALDEFLKKAPEHASQSPANFTVVTIPSGLAVSPGTQFPPFEGTARLAHELEKPEAKDSCRLIIVENVCAQTINLLGEKFDIDPQFFADHLNNEPWYRIANVADRIPALPSTQKHHDFLQLRYIEPRQLSNYQDLFHGNQPFVVQKENADVADEESVVSDTKSFMKPDETTTRIPRKAGKLTPRVRKGREFDPLLCTRQVITVWFEKSENGSKGWTGIILLDPPFKLPPGNFYCGPAGHRSFNRRASLLDDEEDTLPPTSNHEALVRHFRERFFNNPSLLENARSDCFFVLGDVYRLVASNWIVINEYVNRELATIEYILEKEEPTFRDLEVYLKDLYIYRRRVTRYHELITQAKEQCTTRGQRSWSGDETSALSLEHAKDMETDFIYLQDKVLATSRRIEKNIDLLTALVSIGEGKQTLDENRALAKLTLLATVFLPFSTVATIFSIQGGYGPGEGMFWMFWAIAIPLTAFVLVISALYYGIGVSILKRMAGSLGFRTV